MNSALLTDIRTIAWKQCKEIFWAEDNFVVNVSSILFILVLIGLINPEPANNMQEFNADPFWLVIFWLVTPYSLSVFNIFNSVFEERRQNTLHTLLATRIPELAIILGKTSVCIVFNWVATLLIGMFSLAKVYFISEHNIFIYNFKSIFFCLGFSFLIIAQVAIIEFFASLYAKTILQYSIRYLSCLLLSLSLTAFSLNVFVNIDSLTNKIVIRNAYDSLFSSSVYFLCLASVDLLLLFLVVKLFDRGKVDLV